MAIKLSTSLFVDDINAYVDTLNTWLGGQVLRERKNDDGDVYFVMYGFDGVTINLIKPSSENTNTAKKVNGSTNATVIFADSVDKVKQLYSAAEAAGLSPVGDGLQDLDEYVFANFQDPYKHYWHVVFLKG